MSFYEKYDLTRLIRDGDAKTFRAVENATGRIVFVHLFNPSGQALLGTLRSGYEAGGKSAPLIEIGEFAGSSYAVTELIEPFTSLRDWVEAWSVPVAPAPVFTPAPEPPIKPAPPPAPSPPIEADQDEFARLFQAPPPPHPQSSSPAEAEQGEFTRMFRSPALTPEPAPPLIDDQGASSRAFQASPAKPVPPPQPSAPAQAEQGEFTRMFRAPAATPPLTPPPQPSSPAQPEQGEFTRMFRAPAATPSPSPPPQAEQGEFTRMFRAPAATPAQTPPLQPAAPQATQGEFTRIFQAGRADPVAQPKPPSQGPAKPAEPDEFDRMMSRPVDSPSAPKSPPRPFSADDIGQFNPLFGSGLSGEAIDIEEEQAKAARSKAPENRPFQQAGEFTRRFGPREQEGAAPPPSAPAARPVNASASQLFLSPEELAKMSASVLAKPAAQDEEPGSYTRMFGPSSGQPQPEEAPEPKPAPAPAPAPAAKKNPAIVIAIVLGAVALIALVVWIVLSMKH